MARMLRVARARVGAADREAYLEALGVLAGRLEPGHHLWLFERPGRPGEFLEFHEGPGDDGAGTAPADPDTAASLARLATLARYDGEAMEQWQEVTLVPSGGG